MRRRLLYVSALFLILPGVSAWAQESDELQGRELTELSLEQLTNIRVISVSKKEQALAQTAAAVFVITQEDIRRGGFTSIPDALRIVPGLDVAQIDSNHWAISSRGFNGLFSNKLLVLIDGRSVYSPLFSGVYWDVQDTLLEDVDRIEVIRGPGAAVWGANAVNGVINVITKSAKDTQGGLVTIGAGNEDRGIAAVRYGVALGSSGYLRGYTKFSSRASLLDSLGQSLPDGWNAGRAGFRLDWNPSQRDSVTLQADAYDNRGGEQLTVAGLSPAAMSLVNNQEHSDGGNFLASFTRHYSDTSELSVKFYFDRIRRDDALVGYSQNTYDFDLQHRFQAGPRQDLIWGLGYRLTGDSLQAGYARLTPDSRALQLFSSFINDEISLVNGKLSLIVGAKLEHDDFTGFSVQPDARLLWTPAKEHTAWLAVSRAVRLPSRAERNILLTYAVGPGPGGLPAVTSVEGSPDFQSEVLKAYQAGYRVLPAHWFSLDVTGFYNDYNHLQSVQTGLPELNFAGFQPYLQVPLLFTNQLGGTSTGFELAANWTAGEKWRLSTAYTGLRIRIRPDPGYSSPIPDTTSGRNPAHQFSVRSQLNLTKKLQWDTSAFYVSSLPAIQIPGYTRLDTRWGWRMNDSVEFSIVGQDLLSPRRAEFVPEALVAGGQTRRSIYVRFARFF